MANRRVELKHPLAIRWFHWLNFPLLLVMIWSGILIYWANDIYRVGWGDTTLLKLFPEAFYAKTQVSRRLAEGMAWHFLAMWFFTINGIAYVLYTAISGEWRYLLPNRHSLKEAWLVVLHDLRIHKEPLPKRKFNGAQQMAYSGIVLMGAGSVVTGLAIWKPIQCGLITWLLGGYELCRLWHFLLMLGYCAFFLVHLAQVARAGWNNFRAMVTGHEIVEEAT